MWMACVLGTACATAQALRKWSRALEASIPPAIGAGPHKCDDKLATSPATTNVRMSRFTVDFPGAKAAACCTGTSPSLILSAVAANVMHASTALCCLWCALSSFASGADSCSWALPEVRFQKTCLGSPTRYASIGTMNPFGFRMLAGPILEGQSG